MASRTRNFSKCTANPQTFVESAQRAIDYINPASPLVRMEIVENGTATFAIQDKFDGWIRYPFAIDDLALGHPGIVVDLTRANLESTVLAIMESCDVDDDFVLTYRGLANPIELAVDEISVPFARLTPLNPNPTPKKKRGK